jgi:nicotinamide-nucleotide amidase
MKAEIISIGDEILIGQISNTNSVWIAQQLNLIGVTVTCMTTVSDEGTAIFEALNTAKRSDLVFITGGLGPTKDDITKKIFAQFFNVPLELDQKTLEEVTAYFSVRGKVITEINKLQAMLPKGGTVIPNKNGTAPGMWMKKENTIYISMPGVPYEMKGMMTATILPKIKSENDLPFIYHKTILTQGIGESAIAEMIEKWEDSLTEKQIKLAYLPQPGIVRLRLSSIGKNKEETISKVESESKIPQEILSKYIFGFEKYGEEQPRLEKIVSELLREKKRTISLAESCTGGFIASLITGIAGASEIFKGGIVPYTNEAKHELLQVDKSIFETKGAVSKECVEQLAQNVIKKFGSDYSLAVSGIAGPSGGTAEKPVGLVWVAIANKNKVIAKEFRFGDDRQRNIVMTAIATLNMFRKLLEEGF